MTPSTSCGRQIAGLVARVAARDRVAVSRFTFDMGDPKHLCHVLRAVRAIDGVYDVYRVTN